MRGSLLGVCLTVLIIGGASTPATGQMMAMLSEGSRGEAQAPRVQTGRAISLDLKDIPLAVAIQEISARGGVKIAFADNVVRNASNVNLKVSGVSPRQALEQVLKGTSLRVAEYGGQLAVEVGKENSVTQGVIVGRVVHAKTKQPIAGATIVIGNSQKGMTTSSDGTFRIPSEIGEQKVTVRAMGMARQQKTVTVSENGQASVEFVLEPNASVLDEIVVTGTVVATERKAITTPITVITAEDLERRGITSVEQLFRGEVPSVFAMETGGARWTDEPGAMQASTIYTRGVSGNHTLVGAAPVKTFVDGVEILDPAYLGGLDPQSFERIEIVTGPQAATIYGSGAISGVMQIFTKKGTAGQPVETRIALKYGALESNANESFTPSHDHGITVTGTAGPTLSYSANTVYRYSGQWQPALFSRSFTGATGFTLSQRGTTVQGSVSTSVGKNGTNSSYGGLVDKLKRENGETAFGASKISDLVSQRISKSVNHNLAMNINVRITDWWQHHLTLGKNISDNTIEPFAPKFVTWTDTLYSHTASKGSRTSFGYNTTMLGRKKFINSVLTLGGNASSGEQMNASGCSFDLVKSAWSACSVFTDVKVSTLIGSRSAGGFASWQLSLFDQLFMNFGLRAEKNPNYGQSHKIDWTPTHGLSYSISMSNVTIKVLGSYGMATRSPTPEMRSELWQPYSEVMDPPLHKAYAENLKLRPEYSRGPQFGAEVYIGNYGSFTLNRYDQHITDLIEAVVVDSVLRTYLCCGFGTSWFSTLQYTNIADIRQHGWEVTGTANIYRVGLRWSYSWNDSRIVKSHWYASGAGRFRQVPTHFGNVQANYAYGRSSITMVTNFVGRASANLTEAGGFEIGRLRPYADVILGNRTGLLTSRPGYAKSSLSMSHRFTDAISTTLNVNNIGNHYGSEARTSDRAMLGRQTLFGLSVKM